MEEGRRWQAASDGNGTASEGEHWVEVDLGAPAVVDGVVLDWEVRGYSDRFSILGRLDGDHDFGSGSAGSSTTGAATATARRWRLMLNSSQVDLNPRVFGQHLQHLLAIPHGRPSRPTVGFVAPREGNILATRVADGNPPRGGLFPVSTSVRGRHRRLGVQPIPTSPAAAFPCAALALIPRPASTSPPLVPLQTALALTTKRPDRELAVLAWHARIRR